MTPDRYKASPANLTNPQTWNRYTYVMSDPINYYDPRGLYEVAPEEDPGSDNDAGGGGGGGVGGGAGQGIPLDVINQIFNVDLAGLNVGWGYADSSLNTLNVLMPYDEFTYFQAGSGVATAGTIVLGGETIGWSIIIGSIGPTVVVAGAALGIVYLIDQILQRSKADIKQNRQAAQQVSKEKGCRDPEPADFDTVHEVLKDLKGPNGKATYDELLDAWRSVLCK